MASTRTIVRELQNKWVDKIMPVLDGCHLWLGAMTPAGYAKATLGGKQVYVHRVMAGAGKGDHTDHLCRQPSCVNPAHLEVVTQRENNKRQASIRTHCKQGHEFSESNTRITRQGWRKCRTCHRKWERKRRING